VAVVGCIGSGKSTVARALGKALGIEVFHLDGLWWQPGRYRITGQATVASRTMAPGQFRQVEMTITAGSSWIIDGDATNKDVRLSRADTVVFLDLPRWLCAWRVLKRHVRGSPEYPQGVRGSIRWSLVLLRWIWTTWPSRRRPSLVRAIAEHATGTQTIHLRSRREVRLFLDGVAQHRANSR
jgi:adenylate kinase family enzyme